MSDKFEYYGYTVKVIKYEADKGKKQKIYVASTDVYMSEKTINKIIHARCDIENNGFYELKHKWNMNHCYIADENAINVIWQMIMMSYNL